MGQRGTPVAYLVFRGGNRLLWRKRCGGKVAQAHPQSGCPVIPHFYRITVRAGRTDFVNILGNIHALALIETQLLQNLAITESQNLWATLLKPVTRQ
jgi:hypothetical protein